MALALFHIIKDSKLLIVYTFGAKRLEGKKA
jgi:hypothetical protein